MMNPNTPQRRKILRQPKITTINGRIRGTKPEILPIDECIPNAFPFCGPNNSAIIVKLGMGRMPEAKPIKEQVKTKVTKFIFMPIRKLAKLKNTKDNAIIFFRPTASENAPPGYCIIP